MSPSIKFFLNLFFLANSVSFLFTHLNYIYVFLSTKTLKIKILKTKTLLFSLTHYLLFSLLVLLVGIVFTLI